MSEEGYSGESSSYRGNGVTKYVLERIDALDDKIDQKLDAIAEAAGEARSKLGQVERGLVEHTDAHKVEREARERRRKALWRAAAGASSAALAVITALLAKGA